jgi:hypothetical protein
MAVLGGLMLGTQTAFPGRSGAASETSAGIESKGEKHGDAPDSDARAKHENDEVTQTSGTPNLGASAARSSSGARSSSEARTEPAALANTLSFSGHSWSVKSSTGTVGPGPNRFAARNATVDTSGNLHLRISKDKGKWYSSEIINTASLGYGTYRWTATTNLANLDRNVVLGLFTWNDLPEYANREIDIEIARWGSTTDPTNAQFVVQPYNSPGHLQRFTQPIGGSTLEFTWSTGRVDFLVRQGTVIIDSWSYVAPDVPVPGGETVRMNLWQYRGLAPSNGQPVELVFSDFDYCTPSGVCQ